MAHVFDLDVHSSELLDNPYLLYDELREQSPVFYSEKYKAWFVSKYRDAKLLFHENLLGAYPLEPGQQTSKCPWTQARQTFTGAAGYLSLREKTRQMRDLWLVLRGDEDHKRLRDIYAQPFTPKELKLFESTLRDILHEVLQDLDNKRTIDMVQDIAVPFTMKVILKLFSIEYDDLTWIKRQTSDVLRLLGLDPGFASKEKGMHSMINLLDFFSDENRKTGNGNGFYAALLSKMKNGELTEDELLANNVLLVMAGQETTMHLIANIYYCFMQFPDQFRSVKQGNATIESAIEEVLRFESPSPYISKALLTDIELSGVTIPVKSKVVVLLGAVNRDADIFPKADQFDVHRNPNSHLAFGFGRHYCLGAYLSRLEAKVVVQEFLSRFPDLHFLPGQEITWFNDFRARGINNLMVNLY